MKNSNILVLGGDGYLGWTLGLAFANRTDYNVILADNMIKRKWEEEVGAKSLVPFVLPEKRIKEYGRIFGKKNLFFEKLDLLDYEKVSGLVRQYKPEIIINAAQQPSAPFSMMNAKNAGVTFQNNLGGHLNVLWAIAENDKNIKYIKLGSAGCYCGIDTDYIPLEKVDFDFVYKNKKHRVLNTWLPMYASDFYHQSKITDFLANELASDNWGLKIATVQQSTIFGAAIQENYPEENSALSARFNYDAVFGTVINRFAVEALLDLPLTVYGDGKQTAFVISLTDTVDNFLNIANTDIVSGENMVFHNYTSIMPVNEIAQIASQKGKFAVSHIENPRKETKILLKKEFEAHLAVLNSHKNRHEKMEKEIGMLMGFAGRYKDNINPAVMMPKISWNSITKAAGL